MEEPKDNELGAYYRYIYGNPVTNARQKKRLAKRKQERQNKKVARRRR